MYPGLQHYVYKLLHLQQGEMWEPVYSCPVGRKKRWVCLESLGRGAGANWSLTEETVRDKGNGTCSLACGWLCFFWGERGVAMFYFSAILVSLKHVLLMPLVF